MELVPPLLPQRGAEGDCDDGDEEVGGGDHEGAEEEHPLVAVPIVLTGEREGDFDQGNECSGMRTGQNDTKTNLHSIASLSLERNSFLIQ